MQENNYTELEKAIMATFCYFDSFDYPLTLMEIAKWLFTGGSGRKYSLREILEVLEQSPAISKKIETERGFYFLSGRGNTVEIRKQRYRLAEGKMKRAVRVAKILRYIPFVNMIAVCNNLAYSNASNLSDIDVFVILKRNRLWQTRFFVSVATHLMRMRRHHRIISNRICLSFYITDEHLNLEQLMIKPLDPYFIYWYGQLVPIYDHQNSFSNLVAANKWIEKYLPNLIINKPVLRRSVKDTEWSLAVKKLQETVLGGSFGNYVEKILKKIQKKKMISNKESKLWENSTAVIIKDDILKFHENDRRRQYAEKFISKLESELN
ncbi:MAG: hypothetical protein WC693_03620 [Patescibacteria group bacterium]|jgi:hypothetical protein